MADWNSITLSDANGFPRFRTGKLSGSGGMACVYAAMPIDVENKGRRIRPEQVAVKVANAPYEDALRKTAFSVECDSLTRLRGVREVVGLIDFNLEAKRRWIALEWLEGSAASLCNYSEAVAARIGIQICLALERCHELDILHRDVKPGNILLGIDGSIKLADFGLSRAYSEDWRMIPRDGQATKGTPLYASPEQLRGEGSKEGPWGDIYSLGCCLLELATGREPFANAEVSYRQLCLIRDRLELVPDWLALSAEMMRIIRRATELEPKDRYASAKDLRSDLEKIPGSQDKSTAILWNTAQISKWPTLSLSTPELSLTQTAEF